LITYKKINNIFKEMINKKENNKFNILLEDFTNDLSLLAKDRDDSLEQSMMRLFYERTINN